MTRDAIVTPYELGSPSPKERLDRGNEMYPPDSIRVYKLHASTETTLDWKHSLERAEKSDGTILWELDFALLEGSLSDEVRYLTLELAVQHFSTEVWPHFADRSKGVTLFRGYWTLQNRQLVIDYLQSLAAQLPFDATPYVVMETDPISDAMTFFQLISPDMYGSLELLLEGRWAERYPSVLAKGTKIALCPPEKEDWSAILEALDDTPFRIIPEKLLTQEWDGVDDLIVFSEFMNARGRRKLLGFCAAEGRVVTVGPPLDLPQEISFSDYKLSR